MNSPAVARGRMIETRHVAKNFGQTSALRDASLCVAQGEILAVMGPSGSGKSTLLHCMAGIYTPDQGEVLFAKVTLALMLGRPAAAYLDTQRAAHLRRMQELTEIKRAGPLVDTLLADHALFHLEADLRWIDLTSARLADLAEAVRSR